MSGRGGTTSLGPDSGHAPGKDGVGEAAGIMKVKVKKEKKGDARQRAFGINHERVWHCSIEGLRIPS